MRVEAEKAAAEAAAEQERMEVEADAKAAADETERLRVEAEQAAAEAAAEQERMGVEAEDDVGQDFVLSSSESDNEAGPGSQPRVQRRACLNGTGWRFREVNSATKKITYTAQTGALVFLPPPTASFYKRPAAVQYEVGLCQADRTSPNEPALQKWKCACGHTAVFGAITEARSGITKRGREVTKALQTELSKWFEKHDECAVPPRGPPRTASSKAQKKKRAPQKSQAKPVGGKNRKAPAKRKRAKAAQPLTAEQTNMRNVIMRDMERHASTYANGAGWIVFLSEMTAKVAAYCNNQFNKGGKAAPPAKTFECEHCFSDFESDDEAKVDQHQLTCKLKTSGTRGAKKVRLGGGTDAVAHPLIDAAQGSRGKGTFELHQGVPGNTLDQPVHSGNDYVAPGIPAQDAKENDSATGSSSDSDIEDNPWVKGTTPTEQQYQNWASEFVAARTVWTITGLEAAAYIYFDVTDENKPDFAARFFDSDDST